MATHMHTHFAFAASMNLSNSMSGPLEVAYSYMAGGIARTPNTSTTLSDTPNDICNMFELVFSMIIFGAVYSGDIGMDGYH